MMINQLLKITLLLVGSLAFNPLSAQDLSLGYTANDLSPRPMQSSDKPAYLETVSDPSFPSTMMRRISNASLGQVIAPIYSTIQAWNSDESLMLLYTGGVVHISYWTEVITA